MVEMEVKIVALDEEAAILESVDTEFGLLFKWPLKKLPQPYRIGDQFSLELKKNQNTSLPLLNLPKQDYQKKYQLLESLIN